VFPGGETAPPESHRSEKAVPGYGLCTKRLSVGRLRWWPRAPGTTVRLAARELQVLLWNGSPEQAAMAEDWRHVA